MNQSDIAIFKEIGLDEIEDFSEEDPKMKRVWRARFWWYNWFSRAIRRTHNFWGNEANLFQVKNHTTPDSVKLSNAFTKVCGRYNLPVDRSPGVMCGTNQRVWKINKYNKYYVNKRLSVFNTKQ